MFLSDQANSGETFSREELIFDWNLQGPGQFLAGRKVTLDDETLRDGLQNPSASDPSIEHRFAGRGAARVCGRGSAGAGNWAREIEDTSELRGANIGDGYTSDCGNFAEDRNRD
jgi:hypothetical protein